MDKKTRIKMTMNKKAIAPIVIAVGGVIAFLGVYFLGFLPIPKLAKFQASVNFYVMVLLWFSIQIGVFYLFFKGGTYFAKGINFVKTKILKLSYNFENYMITHYS